MKLTATKYDARGRPIGTTEIDVIVSLDHQVDSDPYTRSFVRTSFADFEYDFPFAPDSFDEGEETVTVYEALGEYEFNAYVIPYPPELEWYDEYQTEGGWDGKNLVLKAQRGEYLN